MRNQALVVEQTGKGAAALNAAIAVVAALALPAHAQTWPAKPIRMVIPYPPGGPTDVLGRIVKAAGVRLD